MTSIFASLQSAKILSNVLRKLLLTAIAINSHYRFIKNGINNKEL